MEGAKDRNERQGSGTFAMSASGSHGHGDGAAAVRCAVEPDFRRVFESDPAVLLMVQSDSPRFTVVAVSDAYVRGSGTAREALLGRAAADSLDSAALPRAGSRLSGSLERVVQTGSVDVIDLQMAVHDRADEHYRSVGPRRFRLISSPVLGPSGNVEYIVQRLDDVTDSVRAEQARSEWMAKVAHDLLQPLNAIFGYAQLLASARGGVRDTARPARYVEQLRRASEILARMLSDLRDASRIDSGQLQLSCDEVDIVAVVHRALEHHPEVAMRCKTNIDAACDTRAWANADRIEQVLRNLLANAAKYSDPWSIVSIDVASDDDVVRITVTNQGRGITPFERKHLFDRFRSISPARAGASTSGATGLGLGLYIAKGLIEAQAGRIWVESAPGSQTRFHFTLPLASVMRASSGPR